MQYLSQKITNQKTKQTCRDKKIKKKPNQKQIKLRYVLCFIKHDFNNEKKLSGSSQRQRRITNTKSNSKITLYIHENTTNIRT